MLNRGRTRSILERIVQSVLVFTAVSCAFSHSKNDRVSVDDLVRQAQRKGFSEDTVGEVDKKEWGELPAFGGFLYFLGEEYRKLAPQFNEGKIPEKSYSGKQLSNLLKSKNFLFPVDKVNKITFKNEEVIVDMTSYFESSISVVDDNYEARGTSRIVFKTEVHENQTRLYRKHGDLTLYRGLTASIASGLSGGPSAPDALNVDAILIDKKDGKINMRVYSLGHKTDGRSHLTPRFIIYNETAGNPEVTIYANEVQGGVLSFDPIKKTNLNDPRIDQIKNEQQLLDEVKVGVREAAPNRYFKKISN